jgi:hypothetical protein
LSVLGPWFHDCFQLECCDKTLKLIPKKKSEFNVLSAQGTEDFAWGIEAAYTISFLLVSTYHLVPILSALCFWAYWLNGHPEDWQNACVPFLATVALMAVLWVPMGIHYSQTLQKRKLD